MVKRFLYAWGGLGLFRGHATVWLTAELFDLSHPPPRCPCGGAGQAKGDYLILLDEEDCFARHARRIVLLATACGMSPVTNVLAMFAYQITNSLTNQLTGTPNTPVDIAAGASQSFVFAFTPTAAIAPMDVVLSFDCTNTSPASSNPGLNTLLLSASTDPVPDVVALAANLITMAS